MMYAGLGIMGGRSHNALTNIGQGALAGLKLYNEEGAKRATADSLMAYRQQQIQLAQQRNERLAKHADFSEKLAVQNALDLAIYRKIQLGLRGQEVDLRGLEVGNTAAFHTGELDINKARLNWEMSHPNIEVIGVDKDGNTVGIDKNHPEQGQIKLPSVAGKIGERTPPDPREAQASAAARAILAQPHNKLTFDEALTQARASYALPPFVTMPNVKTPVVPKTPLQPGQRRPLGDILGE
jgi:hypothetical protein